MIFRGKTPVDVVSRLYLSQKSERRSENTKFILRAAIFERIG